MAFVLNPTIAYKINEYISFGAGIDYMYGMANLGQTPYHPAFGNLYQLELEGGDDAWGFNFGILVQPTPNLRIGANYRSRFDLKIRKGDVTIRDLNPGYFNGTIPAPYLPAPSDMKGSAAVTMPATFAIGVAYTIDRLTLEADADWTFWSKYKDLSIWFNDAVPTLPGEKVMYKNWKDVCALRFGAQYQVTDPLTLRLGVVYDPSPVPEGTMGPELPDSHRMNYMIGLGYKIGSWTIDAAYMYLDKSSRAANNMNMAEGTGFNGMWTGDAWLTALDISYRF
jgi:long-chain fatty acid transport protein